MSYEIFQTRRFLRAYKKLHRNQLPEVDAIVANIATNPELGTQKRGDLARLFVVKFKVLGQEFLLGYTKEDELKLVYLEALGPHENFYRDLK
jgi:mRNA interferase RelE/StbE